MKNKILVTGATGNIGSNIVPLPRSTFPEMESIDQPRNITPQERYNERNKH